jgi:hypothetical protein
MAKCKDERIGLGGNPSQPSFKIPLSSIKQILALLRAVFDIPDTPLPIITAQELEFGARMRPGISRIDTASRVISKKAGAGIDTGAAEDGSENISNKKDRIMVEEIMRELQTKAKIEVVIPTGAIKTTLTGTAGVVPIVGAGTNLIAVSGYGIIR